VGFEGYGKVLEHADLRDLIDVDALDDPNGRRVRAEIAEKLRRWRGDAGEAGAPMPAYLGNGDRAVDWRTSGHSASYPQGGGACAAHVATRHGANAPGS
jgi:hypothetical protein